MHACAACIKAHALAHMPNRKRMIISASNEPPLDGTDSLGTTHLKAQGRGIMKDLDTEIRIYVI